MIGLILAGKQNLNFHPVSRVIPRQLMPVYDKPLIYYSISVLLQSGIMKFFVVACIEEINHYEKLLGDGSQWGIQIGYIVHPSPDNKMNVLIAAEKHIGSEDICVISADLIIFGHELKRVLKESVQLLEDGNAVIFGNKIDTELPAKDAPDSLLTVVEKIDRWIHNFKPAGLCFYPNNVFALAKDTKLSLLAELETEQVNNRYKDFNRLKLQVLNDRIITLRASDYDELYNATLFLKEFNKYSGLNIGSVDKVAKELGLIKRNLLHADNIDRAINTATVGEPVE